LVRRNRDSTLRDTLNFVFLPLPEVLPVLRKQAVLLTSILFLSLIAGFASFPAAAQMVTTKLVNAQGAEAPCIGIGPVAAPVAKKCVEACQQDGFLAATDVGQSGLTISTSGSNDGIITKVDPGSPSAQAGLAVGDAVTAIDGKPSHRPPSELVVERSFGASGKMLQLTVSRAGAVVSVSYARAPQSAPSSAKVSGFMVVVKPLINWENQSVPCMGAGPAAPVALGLCTSKFEPYGYIKASDLGGIGFQLDPKVTDKAVIAAVDAGSPAAGAGLKAGDEIVTVNGKPLTPELGETANEYLFGKAGDQRKVTVHNSAGDKTVALTLAALPKK
jgi:S1-C subfamily serine protease